jgi:hypothetical protein
MGAVASLQLPLMPSLLIVNLPCTTSKRRKVKSLGYTAKALGAVVATELAILTSVQILTITPSFLSGLCAFVPVKE